MVATTRASVLGTLAAGLLACAGGHHVGPVTGCDPEGPARPLCLGFQNPEDLVALPGNEAILVSEYGAMEGGRSGRLSTMDLATETRTVVFEPGDAAGTAPVWGDSACPGAPAKFSPHGIHLSTRENGALQLLVVQHDGRESVEFFELEGSGTSWQAQWRGCVVAPDDAWLNSVAAVPGGGFVTTSMMPRDAMEDLQQAFQRGDESGYVLEWIPDRGFETLGGSRSSAMPNGIETSGDGTLVYLNASGSGEVRRILRATGEVQATAPVGSHRQCALGERRSPGGGRRSASTGPPPTSRPACR